MKRLIEATAYLWPIWLLAVFLPSAAAAQGLPGDLPADAARFVGPAMNLEDVPVSPGGPRLTVVTPEGNVAHILPTAERTKAFRRANPVSGTGPLLYHGTGQVMGVTAPVTIHRIFWVPSRLQTGAPTAMSSSYIGILSNFTVDYPGHGIDNNNTQYFEVVKGVPRYIQNAGVAPAGFIDNAPYPRSGCNDPATPGNCINDAQIHAEILKVMAHEHWTADINTVFVLFTSSGEGSCLTKTECNAPGGFCAYHSAFGSPAGTVIYANVPFGNPAGCAGGGKSPNGNPAADAAAGTASHEITEAITDPLSNAWFAASGDEIGDLCNQEFGTNTWASGLANQMWNGHFYELQTEFDNHVGFCVPIGP